MTELNQNSPATVPEQPEAKLPLKKGMPVVIALVAILAILGIANVTSLLRGNKKAAPASSLQMRPTSPNAQQVSSFETQQQLQAKHDADERQHQQQLVAAMQQLQAATKPPSRCILWMTKSRSRIVMVPLPSVPTSGAWLARMPKYPSSPGSVTATASPSYTGPSGVSTWSLKVFSIGYLPSASRGVGGSEQRVRNANTHTPRVLGIKT